ncbi:MAG: energy transducer TonB [Methylococcaceae bacterium]|nr:MAG: energy transducer TonB [Methylococcaceae bacterium]
MPIPGVHVPTTSRMHAGIENPPFPGASYHCAAAAWRLKLALLLAALLHLLVIVGFRSNPPPRTPPREPLQVTLQYFHPASPIQNATATPPDSVNGRNSRPLPVKPARPKPPARSTGLADGKPKSGVAPVAGIDRALLQQQISQFSSALIKAQERSGKQAKVLPIQAVRTHKYAASAYEKAWQEKIERIGNLNYPEAARRQNLSGSLMLSVTVDRDGKIHGIDVRRSSGHAVLDEAAKHIVQLAAPFAPFPEGLRQEAGMLVITRNWKFFNDARFSAAP